MAGGQACATANAGTTFLTIPIETKSTEMKHWLTRTQWDTNLRRGARRGDSPHGGAMARLTEAHRYGIPWHHLSKWGHGKVEQLITNPMEVVAVSRRALRVRVDNSGELEREEGHGLG